MEILTNYTDFKIYADRWFDQRSNTCKSWIEGYNITSLWFTPHIILGSKIFEDFGGINKIEFMKTYLYEKGYKMIDTSTAFTTCYKIEKI